MLIFVRLTDFSLTAWINSTAFYAVFHIDQPNRFKSKVKVDFYLLQKSSWQSFILSSFVIKSCKRN